MLSFPFDHFLHQARIPLEGLAVAADDTAPGMNGFVLGLFEFDRPFVDFALWNSALRQEVDVFLRKDVVSRWCFHPRRGFGAILDASFGQKLALDRRPCVALMLRELLEDLLAAPLGPAE